MGMMDSCSSCPGPCGGGGGPAGGGAGLAAGTYTITPTGGGGMSLAKGNATAGAEGTGGGAMGGMGGMMGGMGGMMGGGDKPGKDGGGMCSSLPCNACCSFLPCCGGGDGGDAPDEKGMCGECPCGPTDLMNPFGLLAKYTAWKNKKTDIYTSHATWAETEPAYPDWNAPNICCCFRWRHCKYKCHIQQGDGCCCCSCCACGCDCCSCCEITTIGCQCPCTCIPESLRCCHCTWGYFPVCCAPIMALCCAHYEEVLPVTENVPKYLEAEDKKVEQCCDCCSSCSCNFNGGDDNQSEEDKAKDEAKST